MADIYQDKEISDADHLENRTIGWETLALLADPERVRRPGWITAMDFGESGRYGLNLREGTIKALASEGIETVEDLLRAPYGVVKQAVWQGANRDLKMGELLRGVEQLRKYIVQTPELRLLKAVVVRSNARVPEVMMPKDEHRLRGAIAELLQMPNPQKIGEPLFAKLERDTLNLTFGLDDWRVRSPSEVSSKLSIGTQKVQELIERGLKRLRVMETSEKHRGFGMWFLGDLSAGKIDRLFDY